MLTFEAKTDGLVIRNEAPDANEHISLNGTSLAGVWLSSEVVAEIVKFFEDSDARRLIGLKVPELDGESYGKLRQLTNRIPQHDPALMGLLMTWIGSDPGRLSVLLAYVFQRGWQYGNQELMTGFRNMNWLTLAAHLSATDSMLRQSEQLFAVIYTLGEMERAQTPQDDNPSPEGA